MTVCRAKASDLTKDQLVSIINKQTEVALEDEKEITTLKEELEREREAVDFYANIKNYADNTGYQSPPESTIIDWRLGDNETVEGHWYGGKKARETQRKRRILS